MVHKLTPSALIGRDILPRVAAFVHPVLDDYQLLDSGGGEKLERFGEIVLRRPDPQALWRRHLGGSRWRADLNFVRESDRGGAWQPGPGKRPPKQWYVRVGKAKICIRPTPFKHVGLFPEQSANWQWVEQQHERLEDSGVTEKTLLNLFGYTGVASILAAQSGWKVTHVDASKTSISWAVENSQASGLDEHAIRWMCDDASAFVAREVRRGKKYHGILLDPPNYGRGPKGQKWQFDQHIAPLMESCRQLLATEEPSFLVLSTYAIGYSPIAFENMLRDFGPGEIETGELALPEEGGERLLPCGFCARYVRHVDG